MKKFDINDESLVNEFKTELSVQHKLHHPNVLQFFGVVLDAGAPLVLIEHMDGGSLQDAFTALESFTDLRATQVRAF